MADTRSQIKGAFAKADINSDGVIGRAELAEIFKDLGEWNDDELKRIFDSVDVNDDGIINYNEFIDWIMDVDQDDRGVAEQAQAEVVDYVGDDMDDIDDEEAGDELENEVDLGNVDLNLDQLVTLEEWKKIMRHMKMPTKEAESIYQELVREAEEEGKGSIDGGVPLHEFLEELKVEFEDVDTLKAFATAAAAARDEMERGEAEDQEEDDAVDDAAILSGLDKVVCALDRDKRPSDEAPQIMKEGGVPLSKVERTNLERLDDDTVVTRVKQIMTEPPLLNSTAGMQACGELCAAEITRIVQKCKEDGTKFTDPDWDFQAAPSHCLYVDKEAPGYDCTVAAPAAYKRISELFPDAVLIDGGAKAGDIVQGQIGTCFLLGAIGAVVSNNANAIRKLFIKYDFNVGVFGVRFNVSGEWTWVVIDDWMPVDQYDRLLYAKSKDNREMWVPLLEKAYCKLHTCYEMCDGGFAREAIASFFGGISGKLTITQKHRDNPASYFKVVKQARQHGWLLTANFVIPKGVAKTGGTGKCGEDMLPCGLVGGHVYSVLKVVEVDGNHLVCLRNPWGTGEWTGKWSDKNADGEWTDEIKAATGYELKNDGKFWMSIDDFVANTTGVEYARTFGPQWSKITQYKQFAKGSIMATAMFPYTAAGDDEIGFQKGGQVEVDIIQPGWWVGKVEGTEKQGLFPGNYVKLNHRPVARFDLTVSPETDGTSVTVVVMVMQPNKLRQRRFYKRKNGQNYKDTSYPDIQLCVLGPDGQVAMKKKGRKRCIWGELHLKGGNNWRVYALSPDGLGQQFSVRTYVKDCKASLTEVPGAAISELPAEAL